MMSLHKVFVRVLRDIIYTIQMYIHIGHVLYIQIMHLLTHKAEISELVYSKEFNIKSCFSTLVWLVSLISPAKNISSTTVYT